MTAAWLTVLLLEDLTNQQQEPFLSQPAHVKASLAHKRDLQFLLKVMLFARNLIEKWSLYSNSRADITRTEMQLHVNYF